jgi:DNA invertase Pin-like site-specific DNA recombinase
MLFGMKGIMSDMELATIRERSYEASLQKAKRGALFTSVPIGYVRASNSRIELDPDLRIRKAIALVFRRFQEYGSARQVLLWLREEGIDLPASAYGAEGRHVV